MPEKSVEDYAVIWCWGAYSTCLLPMECWGWKVISQFYYWLKIKIGSIFHSSLKISHPPILHNVPCSVQFSSIQSLSHVRLLATPWITAHQRYKFYKWNHTCTERNQEWNLSLSLLSIVQSCPALSDPVDCSMPGFPVLLLSRGDESILIMTSNQRW